MPEKYHQRKFNIGAPSKKYKDNYDAIFRKDKNERPVQNDVPPVDGSGEGRSVPDETKGDGTV